MSTSELKEIDKIVGPALDKNKKLPKSAVCNRPDTVYSFNIALDMKPGYGNTQYWPKQNRK